MTRTTRRKKVVSEEVSDEVSEYEKWYQSEGKRTLAAGITLNNLMKQLVESKGKSYRDFVKAGTVTLEAAYNF